MTVVYSRYTVELCISGLPAPGPVYLSGSIPELGFWSEENAIAMAGHHVDSTAASCFIRFNEFIEYFKFRFFCIDTAGILVRDARRTFSIPDSLLGDMAVSCASNVLVRVECLWGASDSRISVIVPEKPLQVPAINKATIQGILGQVKNLGRIKDELRNEILSLRRETQVALVQSESELPYGGLIRDLLYEINELKGKVKVVARIRPLIEGETQPFSYEISGNNSLRVNGQRSFVLDEVFDDSVDNVNFFETSKIKSVVESSVLIANNVCVFSYGQTNSGKTHTVLGSRGEPGLVELSLGSILEVCSTHRLEKIIEIEMVEIYRENVFVLIDKCEVIDSNQTINLLRSRILDSRATAATNLNNTSSRSHCIIAISISDEESDATSTIYIVDLAGSERIKVSGAQGDRLAEANAINKSLSTLGLVLNSLLHKKQFVPYRDSKLTKILAPVFTVSNPPSKVVMIANVSPALVDERETVSTLQFAQRVCDIELRENAESALEIIEKERELHQVIQKQRSEMDLQHSRR